MSNRIGFYLYHVISIGQSRLIRNTATLFISIVTSACRWQRRLTVRYYVGFLEQIGCAHENLTEMVCIFIFVDVNTKQEIIPPNTRSIKSFCFKNVGCI